MKKFLVYILLLLSLVAVTACGKKDPKQNLQPKNKTEITPAVPSKTAPKESESEQTPSSALREEAAPSDENNAETEVSADSNIVTVPSSAPETSNPPKDTSSTQTERPTDSSPESDTVVTPAKDKDTSSKTPETSEPSKEAPKEEVSGIVIGKDGSVTVGRDTLEKVIEEEKGIVDALGLTEEEIDAILEDGSLVITSEMRDKLLEYVDSLSFGKKLKLLTKLNKLLDN